MAHLQRKFKVSERRACRVVGQQRSTQRYVVVPSDFEARLVKEMKAFAEANPRWGYRRIHALLVDVGWAVNLKRIERLWRAEGLRVPPRRKNRPGGKGPGQAGNSAWARPALRPGHTWSYDFVALRTQDGRPLRVLNVVDEYTRVAVGFHVARSIGTRAVQKVLEGLFQTHPPPQLIRSDNGKEFISSGLIQWLGDQGVTAVPVAKASPQQNCYVERFNGSMRDELLDGELFHSVLEAKVVIGRWIDDYNHRRPHRGLGMITPVAFDKAERARIAVGSSDGYEGSG
ncbi:IS3 family transposase [Spongisporangium articulatum]|uniref:IS3 family transposase n=1 Tax=Spongisporangium articulatum TaxID=3362603 RepID=A0ABW8AU71_9ACTN